MTNTNPFNVEQLADWAGRVRTQEDTPWLLQGLVPAQGITVLSGRQKKEGHKSWLLRMMTVSMATGKPFDKLRPDAAVPTWYIDREGAAKLTLDAWDKLARGMGFNLDDTRPNLHYTHLGAFFLTERTHIEAACRYVVENGIKCVCIDTFAKSFIGDENSSEVTGAALRACAKLQNAGAAVVLVHHLKKGELAVKGGEPTPDEDIRGSGAIAGAFDMHLAVRKYGQFNGIMHLLYGGKYSDWRAMEVNWDISDAVAKLKLNEVTYPSVDETPEY